MRFSLPRRTSKIRRNIPAISLALVTLIAIGGHPSIAEERLVLVTPINTVDTLISEVITRQAYKRIGIDVEIRKYPGERALRLADSGTVDGEVQRINGIAATYKNLIQIRPAINFIDGAAFTRTKSFEVQGWNSLRPYRIGFIRGIKFAERNTRGMNATSVKDYKNLFHMLANDRFDIIVSPRLNGLYQIRKHGVSQIQELAPAIMRFELFHYLNKRHAPLASKISAVFAEMESKGELAAIRQHVVQVLLERAKKGLPICDDDYACFERTVK